MKNAANYKEIFAQKKAMMEELEDVLSDIEYREKSILRTYVETGEEQRKDGDGNLLYLDENGERTIEVTDKPCMKTVYVDTMLDPSQLDEYTKPKYEAIQKVKEAVLALA